MNATARNLSPDADAATNPEALRRPALDATAHYEPSFLDSNHDHDQPGQGGGQWPMGLREMPKFNPQPAPPGQGRYTYGSGARPLDGYTIKRAIGRGGFGEVYYATSDSGKEVALKLILRNLEIERRGVLQCMNLKCPNLLTIYDLRGNDQGESFVIMEYVAGPSLANVLARYPQGMPLAEARAWLRGLVEGVAYLHDHGVVHRDLKPANLFMEEGIVKIGDYGLAKLITPSQGTEHSESIGTCHYMAPELASGKYGKPIDIYAMGIILHEMLTGRVPFEGETVGEVLMKHLTARPVLTGLPEPFRTIIGKALSKDPGLRPQRVQDLLPREDAPRAPSVRFIGDGKTQAAIPEAHEPPPREDKDDVLRIGEEEPIFYIGPETKPPRVPLAQRLQAALARPIAPRRPVQRPAGSPPPARPARQAAYRPQPQPRPQPRQQPRPQQQPPQPPERPPLPGPRQRLAELASSMTWAAPVAAILAVPVALMLGVDIPSQPEQYAALFGTALVGAWATMIPGKVFEGRQVGRSTRRSLALITGAAVGLAGAGLASTLDLGPMPGWDVVASEMRNPDLDRALGARGLPSPLTYGLYFSLIGLATGWTGMAARDRKKRFRVFSVAKAAAVAGLAGLALPFPQPWGVGISALTATVVQAVSPWSAQAATYTRYAARAAKAAARGRRLA